MDPTKNLAWEQIPVYNEGKSLSEGGEPMGIEFELKYRASAGDHAAVEAAFGPMEGEISMATTYYDTRDHALSQRHITLRTRLENGVSVCTVKTPAGDAGRGEWECLCEDIDQGLLMLCKLGAPRELLLLTAQGVFPVCGARFVRKIKTLRGNGFTAELAMDTGVLTGGGQEAPLREIELELKEGSREALVAFAADFAQRFHLTVEKKSKFRRAKDLAEGAEHG